MITACMSKSWKVEVCQKTKIAPGRRDDQPAISSKEHVKYEATQTYFCQLRTNTTAFTWPANDCSNGVRDHSNNKARHPPESLLGKRKHQTRTMRYGANACHPLVFSVDTVDYYDLCVAQLGISRCWSCNFKAELCASGVLDDPRLLGIFRLCDVIRTYIPKYRVGHLGIPTFAIFCDFVWRKDAVYLLFVPGRDPPAATWPAHTQHMTAQQHTHNQPLHV